MLKDLFTIRGGREKGLVFKSRFFKKINLELIRELLRLPEKPYATQQKDQTFSLQTPLLPKCALILSERYTICHEWLAEYFVRRSRN